MKRLATLILASIAFSVTAEAHSGRTDSNGGHNCSQKSKEKGLCTGYHYHNGDNILSDPDINYQSDGVDSDRNAAYRNLGQTTWVYPAAQELYSKNGILDTKCKSRSLPIAAFNYEELSDSLMRERIHMHSFREEHFLFGSWHTSHNPDRHFK